MRRRPCTSRGFTLTELMIAIAVLIGVLLATSKIFSTTSKVTGAGEALADILQEVGAIERQIRADFERLSHEGFFAIRNVAVPNDINGAVLLNPSLPPAALLRCDQLVFFTHGLQSAQTLRVGHGLSRRGQGTAARTYYGHAFQVGEPGLPVELRVQNIPHAHDPSARVFPWAVGAIPMVRTRFDDGSSGLTIFDTTTAGDAIVPPVDARKWLFVRQAVILVDDDDAIPDSDENDKARFLGGLEQAGLLSARSIFLNDPRSALGWTPQLMQGRVDAAATMLDELRSVVQFAPEVGFVPRPWWDPGLNPKDQFSLISEELVYYPRAERSAPSMNRVDQALTANVLGSACSSVKIDWTYGPGVGYVVDPDGIEHFGVVVNPELEQRWFGMTDGSRGVQPYDVGGAGWTPADTIFNVERYPVPGWNQVESSYEAIFGYNQTDALSFDGVNWVPDATLGYTPWPTAIRITLTVHDPRTKLEGGREVQFVINLPEGGAAR